MMRRATPALLGTGFVLAHVALLAPFVPATDILSMGSGLLSLSAMALTMALAARWQWVDHVMGGPDKSYVAHRWLGFFALGGALVHWVTADDSGRGIVPFLADSAEGVGTFAVVGLLALSAAAMVRIIPYHLWKKSHMLMGPLFIAAAYHSIFAASPLALGSPPWIVMAGMSVLGLVGWGQTLLRKSASTALVTVDRVTRFDGGVDVHVTSETALAGFRPGQFATISYDAAGAESHPFTIAGGDAFSRRFVIRAGGDWTNRFVKSVQPGDQLRLGASVGRFRPQFQETRTEQLWVAGGVGITPFLAALEPMQPDQGAPITLIYCVRSRASAGVLEDLEAHAGRLPQLTLIPILGNARQRLASPWMTEVIKARSAKTKIYFCGPEGLKETLTRSWHSVGRTARIQSEDFDFRAAFSVKELVVLAKPLWSLAQKSVVQRSLAQNWIAWDRLGLWTTARSRS